MRFFQPDPDRIAVAMQAAAGAKLCVDVGANQHYRFPLAQVTVGWEGDIKCDLSCEPLPFGDGEVDFLFCRHTLEDLADPRHLLAEIKRVAKAGYLEIPSPLAETTRGVEGCVSHFGYCHHRWIGCGTNNSIILCAKYPLIERLPLRCYWDLLQEGVQHWNTHCLFNGDCPLDYRVSQHADGFNLSIMNERGIQIDYLNAITLLVDWYLAFSPGAPHDRV